MSRPSYHRSSSSRLPYTASKGSYLWFLLFLILGSWVYRRLSRPNGIPLLGDRLFRAHESWQWLPIVDEDEDEDFEFCFFECREVGTGRAKQSCLEE